MVTKFDVWKWLNSEQNYFEGVDMLDTICPNHVLLTTLKSGASFMNRKYLEATLKKLYLDFPTEIKVSKAPASTASSDNTKEISEDDKHRMLEKELAKLHIERRKLSNNFYDCSINEERALLSDKIKNLIVDINTQKSRINVYKETGVVPPLPAVKKDLVMPEDNGKLQRLILTWRSKVSSQRRLIKEYDSKPRQKSKAQHEYYLSQLETTLRKLEDERERRT